MRESARFLSINSKQYVLAEWGCTKRCWRAGDLQGTGEPDADVVPWCDRINELPGICTLQSCAGHDQGGTIQSAHLWIWMSATVAERFNRNAFLMYRNRDAIDSLSRHYLRDGKEIASITFFGNERDRLEESLMFVFGFLCGIADESD